MRRWAIVTLLICSFLAAGLAYGWRLLPGLIGDLAKSQLREMGLQQVSLEISALTLQEVVVSGLRFGGDGSLEVPELKARFDLLDLITGRVEELVLTDVRMRLKRTAEGLSFGALDPLFIAKAVEEQQEERQQQTTQEAAGDALRTWPIQRVIVQDAIIEVVSPFGTTVMPFSGRIEQAEDLSVALTDTHLALQQDDLQLSADLAGRISPDGAFTSQVELSETTYRLGDVMIDFAGGALALSGNLADLTSFNGGGDLSVARSVLPFGLEPAANLSIRLGGGDLSVVFAAEQEGGGGIEGDISAKVTEIFAESAGIGLSATLQVARIEELPAAFLIPKGVEGRATISTQMETSLKQLAEIADLDDPRQILPLLPQVQIGINAQRLSGPLLESQLDVSTDLALVPDQGSISLVSVDGIKARFHGADRLSDFLSLLGQQERSSAPMMDAVIHFNKARLRETVRDETLQADLGLTVELLHPTGGELLAKLAFDSEAAMPLRPVATSNQPPVERFRLNSAAIEVPALTMSSGAQFNVELKGDVAGTPTQFIGDVDFQANGSGLIANNVEVDDINLNTGISFQLFDEQIAVSLNECIRLDLGAARFIDVGSLSDHLGLCLVSDREPAILADVNGSVDAELAIRLDPGNVSINLPQDRRLTLFSDPGVVRFASKYDGLRGEGENELSLSGVRLMAESPAMAFKTDELRLRQTARFDLESGRAPLNLTLETDQLQMLEPEGGMKNLKVEAKGRDVLGLLLNKGGGDLSVLADDLHLLDPAIQIDRLEIKASQSGPLAPEDPGFQGQFKLHADRVRMDDVDMAIDKLDITAEAAKGRAELALDVPIIRHRADPAWFQPLSFWTTAKLSDGDQLTLKSRLTDLRRMLALEASADLDLTEEVAEFSWRMPPMSLHSKTAPLNHLSPFAAQFMDKLNASIFWAGRGDWSAEEGLFLNSDLAAVAIDLETNPDQLDASMEVIANQIGLSVNADMFDGEWAADGQFLMENAGFGLEGLKLSGINGLIEFESLMPIISRADQVISIATAEVGVPLSDGEVRFEVTEDGILKLDALSFILADGLLEAEPLELVPGVPTEVTISADAIDLATLTKQVNVSGLSATGFIEGRIPVTLGGEDVLIAPSELTNTEPGILRYQSDQELGGNSQMVLQALDNFHYDKLSLKLEGAARGDMKVGIRVAGKNPDFYDGVPVDLEFNVNGRLGDVVRSGTSTSSVPDEVKERMRKFGKAGD